jgi:hypothetical protein
MAPQPLLPVAVQANKQVPTASKAALMQKVVSPMQPTHGDIFFPCGLAIPIEIVFALVE